jgi:hypothetical protein
MNVIILDACREDPFGKSRKPQKGLSQMDAPTQTILAYATSPGNVASDGDGANGLYTESLLREMKVPEAKIEDVFKRVRLAVRRKTSGAQIPWESTSLEEDFWFLPPKELRAASDADKEKQFDEELAQWEKVKASDDPAPLEAFLRRYPSGPFAELAQLQLDRALAKLGEKKVQIASAAGNPYTLGTVAADLGFKVGDSYAYVVLDRESRAEKGRLPGVITAVTDTEVILGSRHGDSRPARQHHQAAERQPLHAAPGPADRVCARQEMDDALQRHHAQWPLQRNGVRVPHLAPRENHRAGGHLRVLRHRRRRLLGAALWQAAAEADALDGARQGAPADRHRAVPQVHEWRRQRTCRPAQPQGPGLRTETAAGHRRADGIGRIQADLRVERGAYEKKRCT